jgi:hypothetical protein
MKNGISAPATIRGARLAALTSHTTMPSNRRGGVTIGYLTVHLAL